MSTADRSTDARQRVEQALCAWIATAARGHRSRDGRAMLVGVCGPQGSGKSTLCESLRQGLAAQGLRAAALSIDDVYVTRDEQLAIARSSEGNRYLDVRGYPGTHDVSLGESLLDRLVHAGPGERVELVRYDKGAHGGLGDRAPREAWDTATGPLDVVLFEGWMLGFSPVDPASLVEDPALARTNELLRGYEGWRQRVDRWVLLEGERVEYVIDWRVDAERARRERDGRGMSDEDARAYVERFLPAYRAWGGTTAELSSRAPTVTLTLGPSREVRSVRGLSP
jgi:D-glycerate 3-kinase